MISNIKEGDRFGDLTVVKVLSVDQNNHNSFIVKCSKCGEISKITKNTLYNSKTGCKRCNKIKDCTDKVYGMYKAIKPVKRKNRRCIWLCECIYCHKQIEISSRHLNDGYKKKCSCKGSAAFYNYCKKKNNILDSILLS